MKKIKKLLILLYKNTVLIVLYKLKPGLYVKYYDQYLRNRGVQIGNSSWVDFTAWFDYLYHLIKIGDGVVISRDVVLLVHDYSINNAIFGLNKKVKRPYQITKGIEIGDNVFIGIRSVICPGTNIGSHSIIGAGSVVRGIVEPYSIMMGNPAIKIGDTREWATKKIDQNERLRENVI